MNFSASVLFLLMTCSALSFGKKCAFYGKRWEKALGFCRHGDSSLRVGDINGDRRADLFCHVSNTGILYAHLGGTFATSRSQGWCSHQTGQVHLGDFNGDGRQDALCHDTKDGHKWIKFADEAGHYETTDWQKAMGFCFGKNQHLDIGDFNGDNRADMLCHDWKTGKNQIALANQDGHFSSVNWRDNGWCSGTGTEVHIGDFNGDCRSDLMCHDSKGQKWISLAKSAPHIGLSGSSWHKKMGWCSTSGAGKLFIGDFNGDKRADMLCHHKSTGYKWIAYNKGPSTYFTGTDWHKDLKWCGTGHHMLLGDFNADNRDDILCHNRSGKKWIIYNECK